LAAVVVVTPAADERRKVDETVDEENALPWVVT
jgi:hypothetical protein